MSSSAVVVTALLGAISAVVTTLITGYLARPKTKAEAKAANVAGEVGISGDAREWAKEFANRAQRAEERADAAEQRCDEIERKFGVLVDYTRRLQREINSIDGHQVPPPPAELIPPLSQS